jgi:hypothetical protein
VRQLHPVALERFCQRALGEIEQVAADSAKNYHQRFLDLYSLIHDSNKELGRAFDNPRRSTAVIQLAAIKGNDLLTNDEFSRFSMETRDAVETLLKIIQQD